MQTLAAFARNDARNLARDSFLLFITIIPYLLSVLARVIFPGLTAWLWERFGFDLVPYYPLILSFMFILQAPMMFGIVIGLMILDERDEDTLTALRVTPFPILNYALYRVSLMVMLAMVFVVVATPLTGLISWTLLPALVVIGLCSGVFAAATGVFLAAFAANKVEGIALMKATGLLLTWPAVAYFVNPDWQWLMGIVPTYWPAKALWVASEGGPYWIYALIGIIYMAVLLLWLLRRFQRRLYR